LHFDPTAGPEAATEVCIPVSAKVKGRIWPVLLLYNVAGDAAAARYDEAVMIGRKPESRNETSSGEMSNLPCPPGFTFDLQGWPGRWARWRASQVQVSTDNFAVEN